MGEIDPQSGAGNELIPLTPEQASLRTWTPDSATWAKIKYASVNSPAIISFSGFANDNSNSPVSGTAFYKEQGLNPLPASAGIQAKLCRPELLVEIEAIAMFRKLPKE